MRVWWWGDMINNKYDLLELIKKSGAVREFQDKTISPQLIDKIIEAGIWGLSILGIQPWKIICVTKNKIIENITCIIDKTAKRIDKPFGTILKITAATIKNSKALIAIYNNKKAEERSQKYGETYASKANIAEIQCIGGVLQNMFLEANYLGLGCVWIDSPTFFDTEEINKVLKQNNQLIAFLALGYPKHGYIKRSKRAPYNQMVEIIK